MVSIISYDHNTASSGNDIASKIATGELKLPISGYVHLMKSFERMTIEAAVTGDKNLAVAALNLNPLCPSDELANIVIDELLEAHKEYLPQFFDKSDTPM